MCQTRPLFVYFRSFLNTMTNIVQHLTLKSIDGVLGIRTRDCRMVGADESTELKRPPTVYLFGNLFYLSLPKITLKLAKAFW